METPLQQRIVGAIMLVALGVIFIPAILDGSGYKSRHARSIEIPAMPALPAIDKQRVEAVATPLDQAVVEQQLTTESGSEAELKSWMLQVGTFSSRDNADKYRDELRGKGFTTHVVAGKSEGKTIYKVQIGPEVERERIERIKKQLDEKGIDSYVVSHG